jgi:hypothetical protein
MTLRRCPFCGMKGGFITACHGLWWIARDACKAETRAAATKSAAADIWNHRADAKPATPLQEARDRGERLAEALEDACLNIAQHGEQPPKMWLDALEQATAALATPAEGKDK